MELSELGIDIADIKHQIIETAAEQLVREVGADVRRDIIKKSETTISATITLMVEETLNREYTRVNQWGEPEGKKTTLRDAFKERMEKWLSEKVDSEGRPSTYSSANPRYEWITKRLIAEILQDDLKKNLVGMIAAAKAELAKGIAAAVKEVVDRYNK